MVIEFMSNDQSTGNPYYDMLPALDDRLSLKSFELLPKIDHNERLWPLELKLHCISKLDDIFYPLGSHAEFLKIIPNLIKFTYSSRNPLSPMYKKQIARENFLPASNNSFKRGEIVRVTGISGVGKTTSIKKYLSIYPQVISHQYYRGEPFYNQQIVWLLVNFPADGKLRTLLTHSLYDIDLLLGSEYQNMRPSYGFTNEKYLNFLTRVLFIHGTGLLIIDSCENFKYMSNGEIRGLLELLNSIVGLGLSIIIIGSPEALEIDVPVQYEIRWRRLTRGNEWNSFFNMLLNYQWTEQSVILKEELSLALLDESAGIIDIAEKIYKMTQVVAVQAGLKSIDTSLIRRVSQSRFSLLKPGIMIIKSRDE